VSEGVHILPHGGVTARVGVVRDAVHDGKGIGIHRLLHVLVEPQTDDGIPNLVRTSIHNQLYTCW